MQNGMTSSTDPRTIFKSSLIWVCTICADLPVAMAHYFFVVISEYKGMQFNPLTTRKQMIKFSFANFQNILSPSYITFRIKRLEGIQCRSR